MNKQQLDRMANGAGFIAALDQSGGSTPKALKAYGIGEDRYSNEEEMFDLVHEMRTRIITSPAFVSESILGAILFEQTMDREIAGQLTGDYLWNVKGIVPFVKIDKGLADIENDVQIMKPMPELDSLLERAVKRGMFGTKERSVIHHANEAGIKAVVDQQFEVARKVLSYGLVPIVEPEVNIRSEDKAEAETMLLEAIQQQLDRLDDGQQIMLKLSIPTEPNFYRPLIDHPKVVRVVALSGGYSRDEANELLKQNEGLIASFSRALAEGLSDDQSEEAFNQTLAASIDSIFAASVA